VRQFSRWVISFFASPVGVVVLGALDSTIFFSLPLGIDTAVILLAARLHSFAWIVPLLATAGSVAGAALTFWMGAKIGETGLEHYVAKKRLERIRHRINKSGAVALAVLDLIPPPFPFTPFVLAAGALEVEAKMFFATLAACRIFRFGLEALLAVMYGRGILGWVESDVFPDILTLCLVLAIVATVVTVVRLVVARRPAKRRNVTS
jgi:membrane protein YqaA with SNARE-associated domain